MEPWDYFYATQQPERPQKGGECWNFEAYFLESENESCNEQWHLWNSFCYDYDYNSDCEAVNTEIDNDEAFGPSTELVAMMKQLKLEHTHPKMAKQMLKDKKAQSIALLGSAQASQQEESFNYSKAIVGTSVAVLGVAAAIFAARRCSKRDDNNFERALL